MAGWPFTYNWTTALLPYLEQDGLYQQVLQKGGAAGLGPYGPTLLYCPAEPYPITYQGSNLSSYGANFGTNFSLSSPLVAGQESQWPDVLAQYQAGPFYINSRVNLSAITDGASNTILIGERTYLDANFAAAATRWANGALGTRDPVDLRTFSGFWFATADPSFILCAYAGEPINYTVSASAAAAVPADLLEGINALNALGTPRLYAYGSQHGGGANVAMADGSVRFLSDNLNPLHLAYMSTRNGGEVIPE